MHLLDTHLAFGLATMLHHVLLAEGFIARVASLPVERLTLLTADTTLKRYGRFVRVV